MAEEPSRLLLYVCAALVIVILGLSIALGIINKKLKDKVCPAEITCPEQTEANAITCKTFTNAVEANATTCKTFTDAATANCKPVNVTTCKQQGFGYANKSNCPVSTDCTAITANATAAATAATAALAAATAKEASLATCKVMGYDVKMSKATCSTEYKLLEISTNCKNIKTDIDTKSNAIVKYFTGFTIVKKITTTTSASSTTIANTYYKSASPLTSKSTVEEIVSWTKATTTLPLTIDIKTTTDKGKAGFKTDIDAIIPKLTSLEQEVLVNAIQSPSVWITKGDYYILDPIKLGKTYSALYMTATNSPYIGACGS